MKVKSESGSLTLKLFTRPNEPLAGKKLSGDVLSFLAAKIRISLSMASHSGSTNSPIRSRFALAGKNSICANCIVAGHSIFLSRGIVRPTGKVTTAAESTLLIVCIALPVTYL